MSIRSDADFDREFNIAQSQYDNQTPDDYEVELTDEEWADLYDDDDNCGDY